MSLVATQKVFLFDFILKFLPHKMSIYQSLLISYHKFLALMHFLREALGNKTLVLYNEPGGRVLRARRARYTSPLGRVVEFGGEYEPFRASRFFGGGI